MALTDAQRVVVDYLVTQQEPDLGPATPARGGWASKVGQGAPGADPNTVRFRKSRAFQDCELHVVSYSTRDGHPGITVVRTFGDDNGGTTVAPIGGGGGDTPRRDHPWVNFAAQWSSSLFRGGGEVTGKGAEHAHLVRLRFTSGTIAEDGVKDGVVLFEVRGQISFPIRIDVLDAEDALLHTYADFEGFK